MYHIIQMKGTGKVTFFTQNDNCGTESFMWSNQG